MTLLPCAADGATRVVGDGFALALPEPRANLAAALLLGIRPHDVEIVDGEGDRDGRGRVDVIEALGRELLVHVQVGTASVRVLAPADAPVSEGDTVSLRFRRDRLHLFERERGTRL